MIIPPKIFQTDFASWQWPERLVYLCLAIRADQSGECNPSLVTIGSDTGICKRAVLSALRKLTARGAINRVPGGGRMVRTKYRVNMVETGSPETGVFKTGVLETGVSGVNKQVHGMHHEQIREQIITSDPLPTPAGSRPMSNDTRTISPVKKTKSAKKENFSPDSFEYRLAVKLWESIKLTGTLQKEPDLHAWAKKFDMLHRIDGHPYHWIGTLMIEARKDPFWSMNLRSPEALRNQIQKGRLDKFAPAPGSFLTDDQLLKQPAGPNE